MLTILINTSNLGKGGGLQVADSICCSLDKFSNINFIFVYNSNLQYIAEKTADYANLISIRYDLKNNKKDILTGRNRILDSIVSTYNVDVVLTVFGPIAWSPKCPHLCGFALPHLVLDDSPYFQRMSFIERIKSKIWNIEVSIIFKRGVSAFFTENSYISTKWQKKVGKVKVHTVTNFYNQVYDEPSKWVNHPLPSFDGVTILCMSAYYPHKNLEIAIDVAEYLLQKYPEFNFRFVFTIEKNEYPQLNHELEKHFCFIGKTNVSEGPSLYNQSQIMFQPSLLECFSATYPEAMRMRVPIVASDMDFARGLCGNAAVYFSPLDHIDAAEKIHNVATDVQLRDKLLSNGVKQLKEYDTYTQRVEKLLEIAKTLIVKN